MRSTTNAALLRSVQVDLDPEETILGAFAARSGQKRYLTGLTPWKRLARSNNRLVVLTDKSLLLYSSGPTRAAQLIRRVAFDKPFGPLVGSWNKFEIGPERVWVHRRFSAEVASINTYQVQLYQYDSSLADQKYSAFSMRLHGA